MILHFVRLDVKPHHIVHPGARGGHIIGYDKSGEPIYGKPGQKPGKGEAKKPKEKPAGDRGTRLEQLMKSKSQEDQKAFAEARSRGLKLPPAWVDVWVNPDKKAGLQVKGKDVKGRTQYVYSVSAQNEAAAKKFNRLKSFSKALPEMNNKIKRDLGSSEEARVLYLISKTGFRIGGVGDTGAEKQAFGASTLTSEHIKVVGDTVKFYFVGKKGVQQTHDVKDPELVKMMKGKKGNLFKTSPGKVRAYLREIGPSFKVKDFRTHVATSMALGLATKMDPPKNERAKARSILEVAKQVAQRLGNSPAMARDSYIDPAVFQHWVTA